MNSNLEHKQGCSSQATSINSSVVLAIEHFVSPHWNVQKNLCFIAAVPGSHSPAADVILLCVHTYEGARNVIRGGLSHWSKTRFNGADPWQLPMRVTSVVNLETEKTMVNHKILLGMKPLIYVALHSLSGGALQKNISVSMSVTGLDTVSTLLSVYCSLSLPISCTEETQDCSQSHLFLFKFLFFCTDQSNNDTNTSLFEAAIRQGISFLCIFLEWKCHLQGTIVHKLTKICEKWRLYDVKILCCAFSN